MHTTRRPASVSITLTVPAAIIAAALLLTGCGASPAPTPADASAADAVIVVAGAHQGSPRPELPVALQAPIEAAIRARAPLTVIVSDGTPTATFHHAGYTINTANDTAETNDIHRAEAALLHAVAAAEPDSDGDNLSAAIAAAADQAATDQAQRPLVVVIDNGMADTGAPIITTAITQGDADTVVDFAAAHGQVPHFPAGARGYLIGAGAAMAPQPQLTPQQQKTISDIWDGILTRAGVEMTVLPAPASTVAVRTSYTTAPIRPALQVQPQGPVTVITLDATLFETGSAALSPQARTTLAQALTVITEHKIAHIDVVGTTDRTGSTAQNKALSQRRADAVASWLTSHGVPNDKVTATGAGEQGPAGPSAADRSVTLTLTDAQ